MTIIDGRARFGCSLEEFYHQPLLVSNLARRGILVPPLTQIDREAPPSPAWVDVYEGEARWIACCPEHPFGQAAVYVWLEGPHLLFCEVCGNAAINGSWLPVEFPSNRKAIEHELLKRPIQNRCYRPWETLETIQAENVTMGWGV